MPPLPSYDDKTLVALMKKGDRAAFTSIYTRYWDRLYFLAYSHLKSESATEEVVQEVFISLWRKKERLDIEFLPSYLAGMVRYAVYRRLAVEKRKLQVETQAAGRLSREVDELKKLDNRNLLGIVEKLSNELPEKCRLVFIHNKLLDKSIEEVAEIMNISVKTAEAHLTKALKIVRSALRVISTEDDLFKGNRTN